jgi:hypothetical protein
VAEGVLAALGEGVEVLDREGGGTGEEPGELLALALARRHTSLRITLLPLSAMKKVLLPAALMA